MNFEFKEKNPSYSAQKETLITQGHLETLDDTNIEQEIINLREKIDSNQVDLENKKQQLLEAINNTTSPKDIEILLAELLMKTQNLNDLEIQFAERLTIKKLREKKK